MTSSIAINKGTAPKDVPFHQIMANFLGFSRMFGVLPVSNITSFDVAQIRFRWLSIPTLIATVFLLLNGFELLAVFHMVFKSGISFHNIGALTFNSVCYLEHLLLWRLATKWPHITQLWHRVEEVFFTHPYRLFATFNVNLTVKILSGALLANTFLEHLLYLTNAINFSEHQRSECNLSFTFWENFIKNERTQLFILFPVKTWMLPILEWANLSMAYTQSFTDIFIMCISIGLTARLKQMNARIKAVCEKPMPEVFWKGVRSDFLAVKNLIRELNTSLSGLILISCSYSMYFICLQLFNSFLKSGNLVSTIYFWYSLVFIIARTLCKLFAAATIDDASKQTLGILRDVPSSSWSDEVQLFGDQLLTDAIAFSGCGFFFLTRKLIFAMAATIATYELVLADVVLASGKQETSLCD